jgi:HAD superfamily hydrolase (TIGR01484 family)
MDSGNRPTLSTVRLFCSDLDGTLLGNPEASRRFRQAWENLSAASRPMLIYSSGRLVQDVIDLLATQVLPWPDYIIGGVGTQIYDGRQKRPLHAYSQQFRENWQFDTIEQIVREVPGITPQPPEFLHRYKSSWYLDEATPETIATLQQRLVSAGQNVCVVYSGRRYLDVLPAGSGKGGALKWLCSSLSIRFDECCCRWRHRK